MPLVFVALSALPLSGILAFVVLRLRRRQRENARMAALADDADFELRFPETTAERPVTGRQTLVGRRNVRR